MWLSLGRSVVSSKIVTNFYQIDMQLKSFNGLLCDYKAGILPRAIEVWNDMTKTEQNLFTHMNNFFVACTSSLA